METVRDKQDSWLGLLLHARSLIRNIENQIAKYHGPGDNARGVAIQYTTAARESLRKAVSMLEINMNADGKVK